MTVYVDEVFVLNFLLNWLLLKASVKMTGAAAHRLRLLLAAALGGVYAVLVLLPGMEKASGLLGRAVSFALLCGCAFGFRGQAVKPSAWFFTVCCAFCGLVLTVNALLGRQMVVLGGAAFYAVSFRMLVLLAGLVYAICAVLFPRLGLHSGGELTRLTLTAGARSVTLNALRDTGNTLKDPVTGEDVVVADWQIAARLLPECAMDASLARSPAQAVQRIQLLHPELKPRLLPYRAVGTRQGLLAAVRVQCSRPDGQKRSRIVAFSPTAVSDGGLYQALTGGSDAETHIGTCFKKTGAVIGKGHVHWRKRHPASAPAGRGGAADAGAAGTGGRGGQAEAH